MENSYIYTDLFIPKCSKCNCEINNFNLSLPYWCNCDKREKNYGHSFIAPNIIHISEVYKNFKFETKKVFHSIKNYDKIQNKLSNFIKKIKIFLKNLIYDNFWSKRNLFCFSKKNYIDDDIRNETQTPFFNEEYSEKLVDIINNLNTSILYPQTLNGIKTFILDIHFFILVLKKNPYITKKILFHNNIYVKYELYNKDNSILNNYNKRFQDILKNVFCQKDNNLINKELIQVFPIIEKNIFILIYIDDIEMYNYKNNEIVLTVKARISNTKICKINPENLVILGDSSLYFAKIEYDSKNNPISLYYFYCIKMEVDILDFDIINENNIVIIDNTQIHLLNISYNKNSIIYNISRTINNYQNCGVYYIIADKINNQIVAYSLKLNSHFLFIKNFIFILKFYDLTLTPKNKDFIFKDNECYIPYPYDNIIKKCKFKILNNDLYILISLGKIYLISSKYLEIVSQYNLSDNFIFYHNIILEKSKNIIFFDKMKRDIVFKLYRNELLLDEGKVWMPNFLHIKYCNVIEINEEGDFIIIIFDNIIQLYYINNNKAQSNFIDYITKKEESIGDRFEINTIGRGSGRGIGRGRGRGERKNKESENSREVKNEIAEESDFDSYYCPESESSKPNTDEKSCSTCSYGSPVCLENDLYSNIIKYKILREDNFQKKKKKKLEMKKDRNKFIKQIKKHYKILGNKLKNEYEKEWEGYKKLKKYVKKHAIKPKKKNKDEYEK